MALKEQRQKIIDYVKSEAAYLNFNKELLEIYEGDLMPKVLKILKDTLNSNYYDRIKERVLPINILQRYINKVATIYNKPPLRMPTDESTIEDVNFYAEAMRLNKHGNIADEYSHLFKGFAWEPYVIDGKPKMRTIPFDRFLVWTSSKENPTVEEVFIKIVGKTTRGDIILYTYSNEEFDAFTTGGDTVHEALESNLGLNPVGCIPFIYGNRSTNKLIPTQDQDILQMAKMFPVMLTDLSGAILFQAFAIIFGIDVNAENLTMSPNAFWSLKSDKDSDKEPSIGTIKPEVSIDAVKNFIMETFVLWLETKGVRVGSTSSSSGGMNPSGISKIIDEMDVYDIKLKSIEWFEEDEKEFWSKMGKINNYWIKSGQIIDRKVLPENWEVTTVFETPRPMQSNVDKLAEIKMERDMGLITLRQAIAKNDPDLSEQEIEDILEENKPKVFQVNEAKDSFPFGRNNN